MSTIELTADTFQQTIADNDMVIVDWWAEWCGPCKTFAPTFEEASEAHDGVVFAKVDTEAEQALAGAAGIKSIPTLMIFREGVLVFRQPGALPRSAVDDLISQVADLDMDEVHAEAAKAQQAADAQQPAG